MFLGTRWNMQVNDLSRCLDKWFGFVFAEGIIFPWNFLIISAITCRTILSKWIAWNSAVQVLAPRKKGHETSQVSPSMKGRKGKWLTSRNCGWTKGFFEFYETKKLEEMIQFDEHICFKWFFAPLRRNPVNITLTFSDGVFRWILLCIIDTVKLFSGQDAVLGQSHLRNARI